MTVLSNRPTAVGGLSVGGSHVLQHISQGFQRSTHHKHRVVVFTWPGELGFMQLFLRVRLDTK